MKPLIWEVGEYYLCVIFTKIATVALILRLFKFFLSCKWYSLQSASH